MLHASRLPRLGVSRLKPGGTLWTYPGLLLITLLAGPLAEETGWRGFALPRMQARMGALNANLLLGVLWAFWHGPMYLIGGGSIPFLIFVPLSVALAILFAWVFNNTRGSLVATTLMHFSFNFAGGHLAGHLGLVPPMVLNIAGGVGLLLIAVVVVIVVGPKYLSRRPVSELPFEAAVAHTGPLAPSLKPIQAK